MWRTNKAIGSTKFLETPELYIGQRVWFGIPAFTKSLNKSIEFLYPGLFKINSPYFELEPIDHGPFSARRKYVPSYVYGDWDAFYETEEEAVKAWNINISGVIDEINSVADRNILGRLGKCDYFEKNYIKSPQEENIVSKDVVEDHGLRKFFFVTSTSFGTQLVSYMNSGVRNYTLEVAVEYEKYGDSIYNTAWYDSNSAARGYLQRGLKEEIGKIEKQRDFFIKKVSKFFIK